MNIPEDPRVVDLANDANGRLDNMLPAVRVALDENGPDLGLAVLARCFTSQPDWTRAELAVVLAAALIRLHECREVAR